MSNGRTYVLILFLWAALTIVTPALIRMSASAKLQERLNGEQRVGLRLLLPRRALVMALESPSPAPAPLSAAEGYSRLPLGGDSAARRLISENVNSALFSGVGSRATT